jgi:hypothetical protein
MIVFHEGVEIVHVTGLAWSAVLLVIASDGGRTGLAAVHGDRLRHAMTAGRGSQRVTAGRCISRDDDPGAVSA